MKNSLNLEELKNKSIDQLKLELSSAKKELFELRLKNATNQLENTSKIRQVRRNIARIETVITIKKKA
ncbi:MAG: 50S ribosomal protein L29 [Lachnospiraceae bacterium]|jgi:large subunit ribosomal protein L29|nr:50S ribosomal protein L29 [Lachnospiraceae bacterium]